MNSHAATSLLSTGYVFTHDYYIRITGQKLSTVHLLHAHSGRDDTVLAPASAYASPDQGLQGGFTEWEGLYGGAALTLGWDWVMHNDGYICALREVSPRTNLLVLLTGGYDPSPQESERALWAYIDTLPWQKQVIQGI